MKSTCDRVNIVSPRLLDGSLSDMANLTWPRDGALPVALCILDAQSDPPKRESAEGPQKYRTGLVSPRASASHRCRSVVARVPSFLGANQFGCRLKPAMESALRLEFATCRVPGRPPFGNAARSGDHSPSPPFSAALLSAPAHIANRRNIRRCSCRRGRGPRPFQ